MDLAARLFLSVFLALLMPMTAFAATYYVDYEKGNDDKSGRNEADAWKHAPGDPKAEGNAKSARLVAGDVVQFKAGVVYRGGDIRPAADGAPGKPIVYRGTGWGDGRAIIDGSELITGWKKCAVASEAYGNPNFAQLWQTQVEIESPFLANLHEMAAGGIDEFLWTSQTPNPKDPFFFDRRDSFFTVKRENLTTTSITAPEAFKNTTPESFQDASLLIWVSPNFTHRYKITGLAPQDGKFLFDDIGAERLYKDQRDQYFAIYNSPNAIDQPGEFFMSEPDSTGKRKLLLWPRSGETLDGRISRSVRKNGFDVQGRQHIEIEGFVVRKFSGAAQTGGSGIVAEGSSNIVVRNNHVTHNMSGERGYGGIHFAQTKDSVVEQNLVTWNKAHRGIFLSSVENVIVRNNTITYPGTTAMPVYRGKRVQLLDNNISHVYGTHANGITIYIASENVLVAGNRVTESTTPITFQDSGPIYFLNNVTDGSGKYGNVNEWPNTKRGPWASGRIVFVNNTFANAEKNVSLSLGKDAEKQYVVVNNILDGLNVDSDKKATVTHTHNVYTGLANSQGSRYGWQMGEQEAVKEDETALFSDPKALDYRPKQKTSGADVSHYLPKDVFPDVDFEKLMARGMIGATAEPPATPKAE